jgi:hypothetical protein
VTQRDRPKNQAQGTPNQAQGTPNRARSTPNRARSTRGEGEYSEPQYRQPGDRLPAILNRALERTPWTTLDGGHSEQLSLDLRLISQTWELSVASFKGRTPGPFEADAWTALHSLWNEAGRPLDGRLRIDYARFMRFMGKQRGGKQYDLLTDALERLSLVRIRLRAVVSDGKGTRRARRGAGLIQRYEVIEGTAVGVTLNEDVCRAMASEGRSLDAERYFRLERPVSRRLYRYLDARRWRGSEPLHSLNLPLAELASEIPIQRRTAADQKKTLAPAHAELIRDRFLASVDYTRSGRAWTVCYTFPQGRHGEVAAPTRNEGEWATMLAREFHDVGSVAFYMDVVRKLPETIVESIVGVIREGIRAGNLAPRLAGRTFTNKAKHAAKQAGISLGGSR